MCSARFSLRTAHGCRAVLVGLGLLLLLSGCDSAPSASTLPSPPAGTPVSPAAGEDYPPALAAYVPPLPSTPWPTALPEPTATPRPTLEEGRVVRGWGNFPRLAVVATAREDGTLALYIVQGDTATLLGGFEDETLSIYFIDVQLSPGGRYVACWTYAGDGSRAIELVDTQDRRRVVLHQSTLDATLPPDEKDPPYADWPSSMAWLDEEHLLYIVQKRWRYNGSTADYPSYAMPGELWETDLNGGKQQLLAADRLDQVLGVSPDGRRVYFLRLGAEWVSAGPREWYNLYSLDLTSGVTATLWPQDNDPDRYTGYTLLRLPDGSQRVLFMTLVPGDTVAAGPTAIWALDPRSGTAEFLGTVTEGGESAGMSWLATPGKYYWAVRNSHPAGGGMVDDSWWVSLAAQHSHSLQQRERAKPLAWTAEGIVVYLRDRGRGESLLQLLGDDGQVQGEIELYP